MLHSSWWEKPARRWSVIAGSRPQLAAQLRGGLVLVVGIGPLDLTKLLQHALQTLPVVRQGRRGGLRTIRCGRVEGDLEVLAGRVRHGRAGHPEPALAALAQRPELLERALERLAQLGDHVWLELQVALARAGGVGGHALTLEAPFHYRGESAGTVRDR